MNGSTYVACRARGRAPRERRRALPPADEEIHHVEPFSRDDLGELSTTKTREQLISRVCAIYPDVDESVAKTDVAAALEELKSLELVSGGN
jgi:hypothetical protein